MFIKEIYIRTRYLIALLLFVQAGYAQDIQFSQFYNASLYQNPAFAGAAHHHRVSGHQRIQWPALDAKYMTSMISYDTYFSKHHSGFGFMVFRDWQGATNISSTDVALQYSYELHLSRGLTFRPGLQLSLVSRSLNYGITLPEHFTNNGYTGGIFMEGGGQKLYPDVSAGGIFYSNKLWVGFSAHHMNLPNTSFLGVVTRLPMKLSITGGYRIVYKKDEYHHLDLEEQKDYSIVPSFHYKFQGTNDQFDLGVYGIYDFLIAGLWYRGIPTKIYSRDLDNNSESMVMLVGWRYKEISITYSYDLTLSRLARTGTGGSHELNVTYIYKKKKHYKPMKRLPCPTFHHR